MLRSLVGSEMCIRDRNLLLAPCWAEDGLHLAFGASVLCSVAQVSLPFTSLLPVGALHFQTLHPAFITLVTHTLQLISACWALLLAPNTLLAEEVATTGQNWFINQLQTNRTLQVFYLSRVFADKAVLSPIVAVLHN